MTLGCYRIHDDHVEILTDTLACSPNMRYIPECRKVVALAPHLDTVTLSLGSTLVSATWEYRLAVSGAEIPDFDVLADAAEEALPAVWEALEGDPGRSEVNIHLIGWSPRRNRFAALAFPSGKGFAAEEVPDVLVHPEPVTADAPSLPSSDEEWLALGRRLHRERALAPVTSGRKITLGGSLVHTRLERGAVTERVLHRFPRDSVDFRLLVENTAHPAYQLAACPCRSGRIVQLCHGHPEQDAPCTCQSGKQFKNCCRMPVEQIAAAQADLDRHLRRPPDAGSADVTKAGRNEPCPCGSGHKFKKCHGSTPSTAEDLRS